MRTPPLRKFLGMPAPARKLLLTSFFVVTLMRLALWLIPFRLLQKILGHSFRTPGLIKGEIASPQEVAWAVRATSPYVPKATCLVQALSLKALLAWEGIPTDLAIGVTNSESSGIMAHAWVELDGTVLIGGQDLGQYTRLLRQD